MTAANSAKFLQALASGADPEAFLRKSVEQKIETYTQRVRTTANALLQAEEQLKQQTVSKARQITSVDVLEELPDTLESMDIQLQEMKKREAHLAKQLKEQEEDLCRRQEKFQALTATIAALPVGKATHPYEAHVVLLGSRVSEYCATANK